jgi:hypothetical protein
MKSLHFATLVAVAALSTATASDEVDVLLLRTSPEGRMARSH